MRFLYQVKNSIGKLLTFRQKYLIEKLQRLQNASVQLVSSPYPNVQPTTHITLDTIKSLFIGSPIKEHIAFKALLVFHLWRFTLLYSWHHHRVPTSKKSSVCTFTTVDCLPYTSFLWSPFFLQCCFWTLEQSSFSTSPTTIPVIIQIIPQNPSFLLSFLCLI